MFLFLLDLLQKQIKHPTLFVLFLSENGKKYLEDNLKHISICLGLGGWEAAMLPTGHRNLALFKELHSLLPPPHLTAPGAAPVSASAALPGSIPHAEYFLKEKSIS